MPDYLKVTIYKDTDGTAGLRAKVCSGSFSGEGEAWFNISEIKKFIDQLKNFSETKKNPPSIASGICDSYGNLSETLLSFKFYPLSDYRYRLGVSIALADYPYTDCREEEISRVFVELKPEANSILKFSEQLKLLLNSEIEEAVLECP
jgi:hypothetical protein